MPQGLPEEARVPIGVAMHLFRGGLSPAEVEIELIEDFRFHKLPLSEIAAIVRIAEQNANAVQASQDRTDRTFREIFGASLHPETSTIGVKVELRIRLRNGKTKPITLTMNVPLDTTPEEAIAIAEEDYSSGSLGVEPESDGELIEGESAVVQTQQFAFREPSIVFERPII